MKTGMVILNYNDAIETVGFVKTIQSFEIIDYICVVDNGSSDGSLKQLKKINKGNIHVLPLERNNGYASGNNAGLKYLYEQGCENLIVANPDIGIERGALLDFVAFMKSYPQYGVFGPTISELGGINRGWKLPSMMNDILDNLIFINRFFKSTNKYNKRHYTGVISEVECVSGCFFGIKREVIDKIGYLDEGTFLYYEENILGKKMKDAGLKTCVLNQVKIEHNHSVSINKAINHYQKLRFIKTSQQYYQENYYNRSKSSLWILEKTGSIACSLARLRTNKDIVNKNISGRKKVTILSLHMKVGGIEKTICSLANMLIDDYDVEIVNVYKLVDKIPFALDDRVKVTYLSTNLQPNKEALSYALKTKKKTSILKEGCKAGYVLYQKRKLIRFVAKDNNGDIMVSSTLAFNKMLSKYQRNKILVAWEHCHPNGDQKYIKKVQKAVRRFTVFIPSSKDLYEFYKEILTGPKCMYIPLCIDEIPEEKATLNTNQITVMGRLSKEKAYDDMLQVFKEVHDNNSEVRLNIVGDGEERGNLETLIDTLGIRPYVNFHGNTIGEQKHQVLVDTSVFVTTSHYESFGLVLLEAMSYGIPCVSFTSAKGSLEIIEEGKNGYLIDERNIPLMADKINKLLVKTTKTMQNNAIKKARQYKYSKVKKQWLEAFKVFSKGDVKKRVIFTSSAGGHFSELCELQELMDKYNAFIITEDHDMMAEYKKRNTATTWYLRAGTKEHLAKFLWNFPFNIVNSFKIYRKVKPDVVIAAGAHTTVPICYIAKLFGKKVIYIETFANITTKTLSGKLVYPIADLFLVQWEEMLALYPKAKYKGGLK